MKILKISLKNKSYDIYIDRNIVTSIGKYIRKIYSGKKIAVVTDSNVDKLYSNILIDSLSKEGFETSKLVIKAGERSKNLDTLKDIYKYFCESRIRRSDIIIALGGGVVGDITGFAASTYLRGVKYIQVPTTLLAQIDSSIGGKVAVDLTFGKNLVGNFYHPEAVFIDPEILNSLNSKFFNDGMGEVIKYGLINDKNFVQKLMNYKDKDELLCNIEEIIYTCCSVKKEIVQMDEFDTGERMKLNFGHTFGHAVEKIFNYEKYTHGECVALGMAYITERSERRGYTKKGTYETIRRILNKYNLPCEMPEVDKRLLFEAVTLDKKTQFDIINLILLKEIGKANIVKLKLQELKNYIDI